MNVLREVGLAFVGISTVLMAMLLLRKEESFFNLNAVVANHMKLFKNSRLQYVAFYILPLFFAAGLAMIYEAGNVFYSELSVVVGIILSILLAALSILAGKDYKDVPDGETKKRLFRVLKETVNAIVFNCFLCVFLLLYGLVMIIIENISFKIGIIKRVFAGISYYTFVVMILTLFLIVKRISKIIVDFNLRTKGD